MKSTYSMFWRALGAVTSLMLLAGQTVQAGGPAIRCLNGQPARWPNGGVNIPFNPDLGGLGSLDNATAVGLVTTAFSVWADAPSSTVTYTNAGALPLDVDANNIFSVFFTPVPDGLNPVIFDQTGEIFDSLFGPGSGLMGFSGPEWVDDDCNVMEAYSLLNGAAMNNATEALDILVHEFGHYTGLDHSVVNGQILYYPGRDSSGPGTLNPFGTPAVSDVETMFPFYIPGSQTATLEADDLAALADLYPAPGFAAGSGAISGAVYAANGTTPQRGVNVIARNPANPFKDAVSAISGNHSVGFSDDPALGSFTLRGLTPGANYVVHIDQLLPGDFSVFPIRLPGAEEYYNGARESNDTTSRDDPADFEAVPARAGTVTSGINFTFNTPKPGDALAVGDDGWFELALPFRFTICGQTFESVFVNANGNLTFGEAEGSTFATGPSFLAGPPRIAGWWTDLNPNAGGKVTYAQSDKTFTVSWVDVPLFPNEGSNSLSITLNKGSDHVEIRYGAMDAVFGVVGLSAGGTVASGLELGSDLSAFGDKRINLQRQTALYEEFNGTNDLAGTTLRLGGTHRFEDSWAGHNDSVGKARSIKLPFSSEDVNRFTEIEPTGQDVDFFRFNAKAGESLLIRVTAGQLDSLLGLYSLQGRQAQLVAMDDDSGPGVLSTIIYQVPANGEYAVAVTTSPDTNFVGVGASGGRYVLDVRTALPDPGSLLFNGSFELGALLFWHAAEVGGDPYIPWLASRNGDGSGFGMAPVQAQDGSFVAWNGFDGCGPMHFELYQDATIPATATSAVLEWKDRLQWNYFVMQQTITRTYQVQIRNPADGAVLKVLHTRETGIADGLGDSGWITHSADISEFKGQAVRVYFLEEIPECFSGPGQYELDAVRLRVQ